MATLCFLEIKEDSLQFLFVPGKKVRFDSDSSILPLNNLLIF